MASSTPTPPLSPERLVILDRDGVINQDSDAYIKSLDEWVPYPSAIDAIARLCRAGYTVAVATNQSGIARGYFDEAVLAQMHDRLQTLVAAQGGQISHIAYCPHGPNDACDCRKPLPGLLIQVQHALGLETLSGSWMIGDSLRDLQAGQAVACRTALVRSGKGAATEAKGHGLDDTLIFDDLAAFTKWLIEPVE